MVATSLKKTRCFVNKCICLVLVFVNMPVYTLVLVDLKAANSGAEKIKKGLFMHAVQYFVRAKSVLVQLS